MIRRTFISVIAAIATVAVALGQTSVEISLPRNAREGARFSITVTVNNPEGNVATPKLPDLEGCTFIGGPGTSTSTSVSIINGRMQRSETKSYTYNYVADKEGEVKVPSIAVTVDGKSYSTQPGRFVIGAAAAPQQGGGSQARPQQGGSGNFEIGPNELYMSVGVSNSAVYEQQAVEVYIKLYSTNMQVEGLTTSSLPTFENCLIESLGMPKTIDWKPETQGGRTIYSAVVYRALLYPQSAGQIVLKGGEYVAQAYRQVYVQDIFGYRPEMITKEVKLQPRSTTLSVKSLPEPRPANFSGAVGKFTITSRLTGSSFKTNEASTLIYNIDGTGNIKFLTTPKIDFPSEFEVYEPAVSNNARVNGHNMTGTQSIEYTFVPQSVGKFTIGGYDFVYFDPATGKYVTEQCPSYEVDVKKGANVSGAAVVGKQDVKAKNTDIHHIRMGQNAPSEVGGFMASSTFYWCLYPLLLAVAFAAAFIFYRKGKADPDGRRLNRAGKVARKRLAKAGKLLHAKQYDGFYEELLRAMQSYLSDKLSLPGSQLSRDNVMAELERRNAPDELRKRLTDILNDCEMARYTPQSSAGAAEETYNNARGVIDEIERLKS